MRRCFACWIALLAACGGKVVVDPAASSGSGGAGGARVSSAGPGSTTVSSATDVGESVVASSGAGATCPTPFPGISAPCASEGLTCSVPGACCGGNAVCKGGFWTFDSALCNHVCGGSCGPDAFTCDPGYLCVAFIGKSTTYQCATNTCPPDGGINCACAGTLCVPSVDWYCNNVEDDFKVLCDCNGDC